MTTLLKYLAIFIVSISFILFGYANIIPKQTFLLPIQAIKTTLLAKKNNANNNKNNKQDNANIENEKTWDIIGKKINNTTYNDSLKAYFKTYSVYQLPELNQLGNELNHYQNSMAQKKEPIEQKNSNKDNLENKIAINLNLDSLIKGRFELQNNHTLITPNTKITIKQANNKTINTIAPQNFAYKGIFKPSYINQNLDNTNHIANNTIQNTRINIANNYFSAFIADNIIIQPLRDFISNVDDNIIVVYDKKNVINHENALCGTKNESDSLNTNQISPIRKKIGTFENQNLPITNRDKAIKQSYLSNNKTDKAIKIADKSFVLGGDDCFETVKLTLVADYSMMQLTGNADHLTKHLISIINAMELAYLPLYIQFELNELYLSNCANCDPISNTISATNLLYEFTDWGENSNNNLLDGYHVAQLWTNRTFTQSTLVGLAHTDAICTNEKYCEVRNYSPIFDKLRCLSAHELGHTLNASHDVAAGNIMYSTISEYATNFSSNTVNEINTCVANRPCLANCNSCKGVAQLQIQNYTGNTANLVWTHALNDSYIVKYKEKTSTNWTILSTNYSDTSYYFNQLSPCTAYDFSVQVNCGNNILSTIKTINVSGKRPILYDLRTYNNDSIKMTWNYIGFPMYLRLRETGSTNWFNDISIAAFDTSHTFTGLNPCKRYDLSMRTDCGNGIFGRDTIFTSNAASAFTVSGQALSINTGRIRYQKSATTSPNLNFTLRYKRATSSFWLLEIPNAEANIYYDLTGLQPCTTYEVQAETYCGTTSSSILTSTFTTGSVGLWQPTVVNCNADSQTYDLEIKVVHGGNMVGNNFTVSAQNVTQTFTYTNPSPQIVMLTNIPNTGSGTANLTLFDATYPNLCSADFTYTLPPLVCSCNSAFYENFDQCSLPCNWTSQNVGTNNTAKWRIGKTHENNSLNGTCMAYFDDDYYDNNGGENIQLTSPSINLSKYSSATLTFDYNFNTIDGNFLLELYNGSTWVNVWQLNSGFCGFWGCPYGHASINITPNLNTQFQMRWTYNDGNACDWYAAIDNVEICGFSNQTLCNASFEYACDTLCQGNDNAQPTIIGHGKGNFTASPAGLSINATTGEINPSLSNVGTYVVTYNTSYNTSCSANNTVVISNCNVKVRPHIWLQGAYISVLNGMNNSLRSANLLPLQQPYNVAPFNYNGSEQFTNASNINTNMVDWVLVELRDAVYPSIIIARKAAILYVDGWINDINANASSGVQFDGIEKGNYYVVVKHRNHLPLMSASVLSLSEQVTNYNFSTAANQSYGSQQVWVSNNNYAAIAGDTDGNGIINYADYTLLAAQNGMSNGYYAADYSLNKTVNNLDYAFYRPNVGKFVWYWLR